MPGRKCPRCSKPGRFLPATSEHAVVDYYRCDWCRHVWTVDKKDTTSRLRDITIPVQDPSQKSD
jgi:hypothetical protein